MGDKLGREKINVTNKKKNVGNLPSRIQSCTFKLCEQIFQIGNCGNELIKIRSFYTQFSYKKKRLQEYKVKKSKKQRATFW